MPSKSEKQKRFMTIASHDKDFADRNNIPQPVAKEFHEADKSIAQRESDPPKKKNPSK